VEKGKGGMMTKKKKEFENVMDIAYKKNTKEDLKKKLSEGNIKSNF
jgi:hypothetical protein